MLLSEHSIELSQPTSAQNLLAYFNEAVPLAMPKGFVPLRFVVPSNTAESFGCEVGGLWPGDSKPPEMESIFRFVPRRLEATGRFTAALMIPTGVGAEVGGHAGDAGPVARLLGQVCDEVVLHPNVVNASDINEMPSNA